MSISEQPAAEPAEPQGTPLVLPPPSALRVTWGLIGVNAALFLLETWWGGSEWSPTLYRMGAMTGRDALASEPWRVLSSAFLHIGPFHLLLNMWALYVFGHLLEALLGPARLLALYAAAAAGGGLASSLAHERSLAAGASGAVWGLMVAEIVLVLRPRVLFDDVVFHVDKARLLQPLALNLLISLQPGIDLMAHLGGGIAGGLVMASGVLARAGERAWRPAAWAAGALMAACIGLAFAHNRPWELRAPVLELRELPGTPVAVPVPRRLEMRTSGDMVFFGQLPRDPLVVGCTVDRHGRSGPAASGRTHERQSEPSGVVSDTWLIPADGFELQLKVWQLRDAPGPWPGVPEQIARGVVFRREPRDATAPVPSAPAPPPSPAPAGGPRRR